MSPFAPLLAALLACTTPPSVPTADVPDPVVPAEGTPTGVTDDGITAFLGIEYAQADRWALPVVSSPWDRTRTSGTLGPACPQSGQSVMIEDCLFLNVFAPAATPADAELPVLVWIHGGGLRAGEGGTAMGRLAQEGIVVVTFNYRLGLLGFHDWAGWSEADPRNFGQADMVAALQWVQQNIASFGGDPGNVTLGGHSAGGMGVQLMMVDERARGTFHRAISHAGYGTWPFPRALNPTDEERTRIRYGALETDASPEALVARVPHYHLPVVGGADLPEQPADAFTNGTQASVPYLAGANSYDGHGTIDGSGIGVAGMMEQYGATPAVRAAYADDFAVSDDQAMARLFGDMRYVYASWVTVRAMHAVRQPGYLFLFDAPTSGQPGATHGAQYGALLGTEPFPMRAAWLSFVKTGVPDPAGGPAWSAHTDEAPWWMVFDPEATSSTDVLVEKMQLISGLTFPRPP